MSTLYEEALEVQAYMARHIADPVQDYGDVGGSFIAAKELIDKIVALNVLQERRCETCKHWSPPQRVDDRAGNCGRIEDSQDAKEGDLAYATTAYDAAELCTQAGFGCVLWEGR